MTSLPPHLETIVESLCARGCKAVNAFIADMEAGEQRAEIRDIPGAERKNLLTELKGIMRCYDHECNS